MSQYGWADCPAAVRAQLEGYTARVVAALGNNLLGLYLHGSLAMGCFNPTRSDIDLLGITHQALTAEQRRTLAEISLECDSTPSPFELSFVPANTLILWQHPAPYDFHYSPMWQARIKDDLTSGAWRSWQGAETLRDPDLAAHITVTRARGIALVGSPPARLLPPVPHSDYLDSIISDFDFAREGMNDNPVYALLNFCRILCYLTAGQISSKDEAGVWGLMTLPAVHHPLIQNALLDYRGDTHHYFDPVSLAQFADFTAEKTALLR